MPDMMARSGDFSLSNGELSTRDSRKYFVHSIRNFKHGGDNHIDPKSHLARQIRRANRKRIAREAAEEEGRRQEQLRKREKKQSSLQQCESGRMETVPEMPEAIHSPQRAASDSEGSQDPADSTEDHVYEISGASHSADSKLYDAFMMSGAIQSPQRIPRSEYISSQYFAGCDGTLDTADKHAIIKTDNVHESDKDMQWCAYLELDRNGMDRHDIAGGANRSQSYGCREDIDQNMPQCSAEGGRHDKEIVNRLEPFEFSRQKVIRFVKPTFHIVKTDFPALNSSRLPTIDEDPEEHVEAQSAADFAALDTAKPLPSLRTSQQTAIRFGESRIYFVKAEYSVPGRQKIVLSNETTKHYIENKPSARAGPPIRFNETVIMYSADASTALPDSSLQRAGNATTLREDTIVPDCHFVMVNDLGGSSALESAMTRYPPTSLQTDGQHRNPQPLLPPTTHQNRRVETEFYQPEDQSCSCKALIKKEEDHTEDTDIDTSDVANIQISHEVMHRHSHPLAPNLDLESISGLPGDRIEERTQRYSLHGPLPSIAIADLPPTLRDFVEIPQDDDWASSVSEELGRIGTDAPAPAEVREEFSHQDLLDMYQRLTQVTELECTETAYDSHDDSEPYRTLLSVFNEPTCDPVATTAGGMGGSSGSEESSDSNCGSTPNSSPMSTTAEESESEGTPSHYDVPGLVPDHSSMDDSTDPPTPTFASGFATPAVAESRDLHDIF